jgi:CxxC motif-containing protein (DUF1111 family)
MRMVWRRGVLRFSSFRTRPLIVYGTIGAASWGAITLLCIATIGAAEGPANDAVAKNVDTKFNMDAELELAEGRRLFEHEWKVKDERSRAGDGLGPVFNDRSCKACHNQGGTGGGGSNEHNVQVITTTGAGLAKNPSTSERRRVMRLHPGLVENTSVVLHRSGTTHAYDSWRDHRVQNAVLVDHELPDSIREFVPSAEQLRLIDSVDASRAAASLVGMCLPERPSTESIQPERTGGGWGGGSMLAKGRPAKPSTTIEQRNSTALFGAGAIDAIPDAVLEKTAAWQLANQPRQAGRAVRTVDGKIGRFGWKSQQSNLADFTMTACAVEVGLDVPGHAQGIGPDRMNYKSPGHDLDMVDCNALVAYIRSLPAPPLPKMRGGDDPVQQGHTLFVRVGCADCHVEDLGEAQGIYSDLLVHDMGQGLWGDSYGAFVAPPAKPGAQKPVTRTDAVHIGEWRTPPLWGCADSAPYLHDGRAETLQAAIKAHGGQAARSAADFAAMPPVAQEKIITFLGSLKAPANLRLAKLRRGAG